MSTIEAAPETAIYKPEYIQAMAVYAQTANQTTAANAVGVDSSTVSRWAAMPQSSALLEELRASIRYNYGWEMVELFGLSLARIRSSLEKGVPYIYKGEARYHPQAPKDAAITASVLFNMWTLSNGTLRDSTIPQRIDALSEQIAELGTKLTSPPPAPPTGTPLDPARGENLRADENGYPPHCSDNKNKAPLRLEDIGG